MHRATHGFSSIQGVVIWPSGQASSHTLAGVPVTIWSAPSISCTADEAWRRFAYAATAPLGISTANICASVALTCVCVVCELNQL